MVHILNDTLDPMARPLDLARQWHNEGLLSARSLKVLEERHQKDEDELTPLTFILLWGAAMVLAAAVIATPFLMEADDTATGTVAIVGSFLAAAACGALWSAPPRRHFGEALGVTSLALWAVGAALLLQDTLAFVWIGAVWTLGAVWLPQRTVLVPGTALIATSLLWAIAFADTFEDGSVAALALAITIMTGLFASTQIRQPAVGWRHETARALAPLSLLGASLWFYGENLHESWTFQGAWELWVAITAGAVIGAAYALRDRFALVTAVLILAVDAIVFGFDIGSVGLGIPIMLAVTGGLVAMAVWAQRRGRLLTD